MNGRIVGSLVVSSLLVASVALAADTPPKTLHLVGDHWTAWDPPTPAPGTAPYIIVRGDTLWDLAKKQNGNPYLWPQLWERNQYIKDAHWIYPGDPLDLGVQVAPAEVAQAPAAGAESAPATEEVTAGAAPAGEAPGEATPGVLTASAAAHSPQPLGADSDISCSGYIGEPEEPFSYRISGSEYQVMSPSLHGGHSKGNVTGLYGTVDSVKIGLDTGDVIYLDSGQSAGLSPGALLSAVEPGVPVRHPLSNDSFGRFYRYLGRVRVLSVQESTAIAEIVQSCGAIHVGAVLKPYEPEPVPLGRRTAQRPINDPAPIEALASAASILFAPEGEISLAQDHVVFIDRGSDEQVTPGDMYTVYRANREGFPPVPVGEVAVLSTQRHSSLAKIIESRVPLFVGDRLQIK